MAAVLLALALTGTQPLDGLEGLPLERVHGLVERGGCVVAGGLRGLAVHRAGKPWQMVSQEAVRQVVADADREVVWVLFGSGAVAKLDAQADRYYYDAFAGGAKRPWTSCLSEGSPGALFGGQGGWLFRGAKQISETYPAALRGQPVTCLERVGSEVWAGTQDGLFIGSGATVKRFGFAAGIPDPWITAILPEPKGALIATANGGLGRFESGRFSFIETPSKRVRSLLRWKSALIVGTLDGAYRQTPTGWEQLSQKETTFLASFRGKLAIGTPNGIELR